MDEQRHTHTTDEQRGHYWAGAQDTIAAIVEQAEMYLPDVDEDDAALDPKAVEEILNVLYQARAAADTAAGAYARVLRRVRRNGDGVSTGHRPHPASRTVPQQPTGGLAGLPRDWR